MKDIFSNTMPAVVSQSICSKKSRIETNACQIVSNWDIWSVKRLFTLHHFEAQCLRNVNILERENKQLAEGTLSQIQSI